MEWYIDICTWLCYDECGFWMVKFDAELHAEKMHSSQLEFSLPLDLIIDFQINEISPDEKTMDI